MNGVNMAVGCVLTLADTQVRLDGDRWLESVRFDLRPDPNCLFVDIVVPPNASLVETGGRVRVVDAADPKLEGIRWQSRPTDPHGGHIVRLHLEDLSADDRALIRFTRRWEGGFTWAPAGATWARLRGAPGSLRTGAVQQDGDDFWVGPGVEGDSVQVGNPEPSVPPAPPAAVADLQRALTLEIPEGDPQEVLFPGGGSAARTDLHLRLVPDPQQLTTWWETYRVGTEPGEVRVEPAGAATVKWLPDLVRVDVHPGEAPARVALRYRSPDAPTHGERPVGESLDVSAPEGEVAWDGPTTWVLTSARGEPVLPDRQALSDALGWRFFVASMPEPAAPFTLRGRERNRELAADLVATLHERAVVAHTLPGDPLFPRRLSKALRSRLVTPIEGALIVALWGRQLGFDTNAVLIRPADRPPGGALSPAGYDDALVRVVVDDQALWLDPGCPSCAPFELRSELAGAEALAPERSPLATGSSSIVETPSEITWVLTGAGALELRRWLERLPPAERSPALAQRIGGPGASLLSAEGIATAGADIAVRVAPGEGPILDPTAVDAAAFVPWEGTRRYAGPGGEREVTLHRAPIEAQSPPL